MEHKKRILSLDLAKFIAIALVCIGHSVALTDMGDENVLYRWIYSFHMPLFFIISGYFAEKSFRLPLFDFLKKKTLQLVVPTIVYTLIEICLVTIWATDKPTAIYYECIGAMWFLRCLFVVYCISYVGFNYVLRSHNEKKGLFCQIFFSIVLCILLFIIPFGAHHRVNFFMMFFLTGVFLNKINLLYKKHLLIITLLSLFVFIFVGLVGAAPKMTFARICEDYMLLPKHFISGLTGSLVIIGLCTYICQIFDPSKVLTWMYKVGGCTLGIYGIQSVLLEKILGHYLHISVSNETLVLFIIVPCIGTLVCIISYYIAIFLSKYKFMRICFLGRK